MKGRHRAMGRTWLARLAVVTTIIVGNVLVMPSLPKAEAVISTTSCGTTAAGYDMGDIVVTPLHGKAFYTDLKNGVNATYIGYSIKNETASNLDNIWVSIDDFRAVSGTSVLSIANGADADQPVLPADTSTTPVGRITAGGTSYAYFLIKASDVSTSAQRHDVNIYRGNKAAGGSLYGANYNCYGEFAAATRTLSAAANKVTSISVDNASPTLGAVITVTVNGATGVGGAGDSTLDADAMWLSPASVASWPTRALRLETTKLTVKYKKQDNSSKWDVYNNSLLIKNVGCSSPCTTAFKSGTTYVAEFKFRVIGSAATNPSIKPVAQIASGTQMKHTSTYPSTITTVSLSSPTKVVTAVKSFDGSATKVGSFWQVKYKVVLTNSSANDIVVDEIVDSPSSSAILLDGSVKILDKYRTTATTLNPSPTSKDDLGRYHFVGPFTVGGSSTATLTYTMQLPVSTGSTVTYSNKAYALVGPSIIGSSTASAVITSCPISINSDGTTTTAGTCTNVSPEKLPQTITFNQPPNQGAGTTYTLDASSSSGLGVSYSIVSGPCSISGTQVIYQAEGSCVIRASQSGNDTYLAATDVDRTVTILPGQVINFGATSSMTTSSTQTVTITATSGLYVTLTSLDTTICKVGNSTSTPGTSYTAVAGDSNLFKITTYTLRGSCPLVATQPGNEIYGAAVAVERTVPVGLSTQVLTTEPTAPSASYTLANASSGVAWNVTARAGSSTGTKISGNPITYTSKTPSVCLAGDASSVSSGGTFQYYTSTITASTAGLCVVQADQDGLDSTGAQSAYGPADPITISFTVGATPTITVSAVSAVKSGASYTATVTTAKPSGTTIALSGTLTLYSSGDFVSAAIQSTSVSMNTSTSSVDRTFTINASSLPPVGPSGSIELFATFASSDSNYNSSQTLTNAITTVYSPPSVTITRAATSVYVNGTVDVTVVVQGNTSYGTPAGTTQLTVTQGGTLSGSDTATLVESSTGTSTATFTITAGSSPSTDIIVDASYTPTSPSTTYFNSVSNSATTLANRTIDVLDLPMRTVTFNANNGSGTMADQQANTTTALNLNTFTRTAYTFTGWNTQANGGGTAYANGENYNFTADLTLYAQWSRNSYTVTFNSNIPSGSTTTTQTASAPTNLTANTFTRTTYSFVGWNTQADGSGTSYANGQSYNFEANLTLYAQWSRNSYTVTFNSNLPSGSTTTSQTASGPTNLTTNSFTRTAYSFIGWNTQANGGGTSYSNGATYNFDANLTLYAQWSRNSYTVTFNSNLPSGSTTTSQTAAATTNLDTNSFVRSSYSFTGWNTLADGSGTAYSDNQSYSFEADLTLYAQWSRNTYLVEFFSNDGLAGVVSQSSDRVAALLANTFSRVAYSFTGWNTQADGSGTSYTDGQSYDFLADLDLFAQWLRNSYTVTFNSNLPSGSTTVSQTESATTNLDANSFTRAAYTFTGWNTLADGSGTAYSDNQSYDFEADLTLYAQWSRNSYTVTFHDNDGSGDDTLTQDSDQTANLTANSFTNPGLYFQGWNTEPDGTGISYDNLAEYDFTANLDLYAQWALVQVYEVKFYSNDGLAELHTQSGSSPANLITNTFSRTAYTFTGWNTQADGSGTSYTDGQSYGFAADLTLYAQWSRNSYTVTFDSNLPSGSTTVSQTESATTNLDANSFTRTAYSFTGWNTLADGSGTSYTDGQSYGFEADLTLYAQWLRNSYTVTFQDNDGSGDDILTQVSGQTANLTANSFTRAGYSFTGWNTLADGSGTAYSDNQSYSFEADLTLYAQWSRNTYLVEFFSNDGLAGVVSQSSDRVAALLANTFSRVAYSFTGWNTQADGSGTSYTDGQSYDFLADLDLFAQWLRNSYTVTFNSNLPSGSTTVSQTESATTNLDANSFTRAAYTFTGWNTLADGSGTAYSDNQSYDFEADLTLYAQWSRNSYTVTFHDNDGSGDDTLTQVSDQTANLTANSFTKGSFTFAGWNTQADGSGVAYSDGQSYGFEADLTLYAQWLRNAYTVTFHDNDGSGDDTLTQVSDQSANLTANTFSRTAYTFTGWNTQADGSGTSYTDGQSYGFAADLTLYAQWSRNSYTVTFDSNLPSGSTTVSQTESATTNLDANSFTRTAYSFTGWNTLADGSGTSYTDGQSYGFEADLTLYAQWSRNSYTVTFNSNLPSGSTTTSQTASATTNLTANSFTRAGYSFTGWNTKADGSGTSRANRSSYSFLADLTLYAQWSRNTYLVQFFSNDDQNGLLQQFGNSARSLLTNSFSRLGFSFLGWNTADDGSGTSYVDGETYDFLDNLDLFAQWFRNSYTVTFHDNDGNQDDTTSQTANGEANLTSNSFTREGYSFTGWNTAADGSGQNYQDKAAYNFLTNLNLYAQWSRNSYTVTFHNNTGNINQTTTQTENKTTNLNQNTFSQALHTFKHWTTNADGTGQVFQDADSYTFLRDLDLYAQWTRNTYTVTFKSNVSGAEQTATQASNQASTLNLNSFSRQLYEFKGWNTSRDGSGTTYQDGEQYNFESNITLYAQWSRIQITVTFDNNVASNSLTNQQVSDKAANLTSNSFSRNLYIFKNWNTKADGTGTTYTDGAVYAFEENLTLYAVWERVSFTATFHDNDGGADITTTQTAADQTNLRSNTFSRLGYSFTGWNTQADGSGTSYTDGQSYGFEADLTLYAQWLRNSYTVTFDSNLPSGSTTTSQTAAATTNLTANSFTRAGYSFTGWNTKADGSGTSRANRSSYSFLADLTLYAQWSRNTYLVQFFSNDDQNGLLQQFGNSARSLLTNSFSRLGFSFLGWNTADDGSGTSYVDGETYDFLDNLDLFAQWFRNSYTVTFHDNDGNQDDTTSQTANGEANLTSNSFTREGYSFTGWNTAADGSGQNYQDKAAYNFLTNLNLYAQWSRNSYTVTFHNNTGNINQTTTQTENKTTNLNQNTFTNPGKVFAGWNTDSLGNGQQYQDEQSYQFLRNLVLYAQWVDSPRVVTFHANFGSTDLTDTQTSLGGALLKANSFTRPDFGFSGWNTKPDGSGDSFEDEALYGFAKDMDLYAQWTLLSVVSFDPNGAKGTMTDSTIRQTALDEEIVLPDPDKLYAIGYAFSGWSKNSKDDYGDYQPGSKYLPSETYEKMYAIWVKQAEPSQQLVGIAYLDFNGNGTKEKSEPFLPGLPVDVAPAFTRMSLRAKAQALAPVEDPVTNRKGKYALPIPAGSWVTTFDVPETLKITKTSLGTQESSVLIDVVEGQSVEIWIGLNSATETSVQAPLTTPTGNEVVEGLKVTWGGIDGIIGTDDDVEFEVPIIDGKVNMQGIPVGNYKAETIGPSGSTPLVVNFNLTTQNPVIQKLVAKLKPVGGGELADTGLDFNPFRYAWFALFMGVFGILLIGASRIRRSRK